MVAERGTVRLSLSSSIKRQLFNAAILITLKAEKINLKEFLQEQKLLSNEKHGPYFEVTTIQASSVTLT